MSGTIDAGTIDVMNGPQGMGEVFRLEGLFEASAVTVEGGARGYPSGDPFGSGGTLIIDGTLLSDGTFEVMGAAAITNGRSAPGTGALVVNDGTLVNGDDLDLQGGDGGSFGEAAGGGNFVNHGVLLNSGAILLERGGDGPHDGSAGEAGRLSSDGTLINSGSIEIEGGDGDSFTGVGGDAATLSGSGMLINSGTFQLDGGGPALVNNGAPGNGGLLVNRGTFVNSGLLSVLIGAFSPFGAGGEGGAIENDGTIVNAGTLLVQAGAGSSNFYDLGQAGNVFGTGSILDTGIILAGSGSILSDASLDVVGRLALDGEADLDNVSDSGTITGNGTLVVNNLSLTGAPGGTGLSSAGTITLGELVNEGTIEIVQGGVIDAVIGGDDGVILLDRAARLILEKPVLSDAAGDHLANQTVVFGGDGASVTFGTAAVDSFTTFDAAGFTFTAASTATYNGVELDLSNGTAFVSYGLIGEPDDSTFLLSDDGHGGTLIERDTTPCFAAGTRIATPYGDVAVQHLQVGDHVLTASGQTRAIVWIGRRRIACERHPTPEKVRPVRIRAHSFGTGLPVRDLVLSPDHALHLEGHLVPVHLLIDGDRIVQEQAELVHYFHIELERHDILLAENLPVESYLDTGNRRQFTNAPIADLHPAFGTGSNGSELCEPMLLEGPALDAIRTALARVQPTSALTDRRLA